MSHIRIKIIVLVILVIALAIVWIYFCGAFHMTFMDNSLKIEKAAVYGQSALLVGENGDCYIRNAWISEEEPYGLKNAKHYARFIDQSFPFSSRLNSFVLMYDGEDARDVVLSSKGGVILTQSNDALLFYGTEEYRTPTLFAHDVLYAKLIGEYVYIVHVDGKFGYYSVYDNQTFNEVLCGVKDFRQAEGYFMIRTLDNELIVTDNIFSERTLENKIGDIFSYDIKCVNCTKEHDIIACYVKKDGSCWYLRDHINALEKFSDEKCYQKVFDHGTQISAYFEGVLILDEELNARVYGKKQSNDVDFIKSEIISRDIKEICGGTMSIVLTKNDGTYLYYGSLINGEYNSFSVVS